MTRPAALLPALLAALVLGAGVLPAAEKAGPKEAYTRQRLAEMYSFFETMTNWYAHMCGLPRAAALRFVKLGGKIRKLLGAAS